MHNLEFETTRVMQYFLEKEDRVSTEKRLRDGNCETMSSSENDKPTLQTAENVPSTSQPFLHVPIPPIPDGLPARPVSHRSALWTGQCACRKK